MQKTKNPFCCFTTTAWCTAMVLLSHFIALHAAEKYPDTLMVPVIFYDYHADGSNPNFESCKCGLVKGEVQNHLDSMHKPVFKEDLCCNDRINEWYRPSGTGGVDEQAQFFYNEQTQRWEWTHMTPYQGRPGEYVSQDYDPDYDMSTIVIYDSLPFIHLGANAPDSLGMYEFERTGDGDSMFFWINNRGYGNEPGQNGLNYGFAMELQWNFQYRPGLTFKFNGDDDVFVFIDDSLVLDLGGVHGPESDSFNVDDIPGLVERRSYRFSLFYAERHTSFSTIQITTNILSPAPDRLDINAAGLEITAGNIIDLNAQLYDEYGDPIATTDSAYHHITWHLVTDGQQPGDDIVGDSTGASTRVTGTQAHRYYMVEAVYQDPIDSTRTIRDTVFLPVEPAPPYQITLERDSIISTADSNEWYPDDLVYDTIGREEDALQMYAFVRDSFGNIIEEGSVTNQPNRINNPQGADNAQWRQEPGTNDRFMTVRPYNGQTRWIGVAERTSGAGADSRVIVSQDGLVPDTCWIHLAYISMGPILTGARYYSFLDAQWNDHDTLVLTFAEPVVWPDPFTLEQNLGSVFALYDASNDMLDTTVFANTTAFAIRRPLDSVGTTMTLLVQHGYGSSHISPAEDSVVVLPEPDNYLQDTQGSEVQDTSRAMIRSRPSWIVHPYTTPINPARPGYGDSSLAGVTIEALPGDAFAPERFTHMQSLLQRETGIPGFVKSTGSLTNGMVTVLDPLGNVMAREVPLAYMPDKSEYVFIWDGLNQNNRRVAAGTYLAIVEVTTENGTTSRKRIRLAIEYD
jgi:fibro-slime domain-containing protein